MTSNKSEPHQKASKSLELCPDVTYYGTTTPYTNFLAVGCYELEEKTNTRRGKLFLYKQDRSNPLSEPHAELSLPGILDLKWRDNFISCATALGYVQFVRFDIAERRLEAVSQTTPHCENRSLICLFVDLEKPGRSGSVAASFSDGSLNVVGSIEDPRSIWRKEDAHGYEAWTVRWDHFKNNILYSGGDDCSLKGWDVRIPPNSPLFQTKFYQMGVTCIESSLFLGENILLVGSYDETACLWDVRKTKEPLVTCRLGGGVWRLNHCRTNKNLIAAACMHNHFQILRLNDSFSEMFSVLSYKHDSLAYGIDWNDEWSDPGEGRYELCSCSFYDKKVSLWEFSVQ